MRRSRGSRLLAAVMAPWLAVVMAEPAALHECAMHSGHVRHALGQESATGSHAMPTARHEMSPMHVAVPAHAPARDASKQYCTCLGGCCAALAVSLPSVAVLGFAPATIRDAARPEPPAFVARTAPAHVLPFANGPPASRV